MKVSIIIISFNVCNYLVKCLDSIEKYWPDNIEMEIILLDNDSTDNTEEIIKKNYPFVKSIFSKINYGFSKGNNIAASHATGDILFLLNPDAELIDESVSNVFRYFDSQAQPLLVAPRLLNSDSTIQNSIIKYPGVFRMFIELFFITKIFNWLQINSTCFNVITEVDALSGAAIIIRRDRYNEIGGFDEQFFWMEDVDLCTQNLLKKGKNVYYPQTTILHHSGKSSTKNYLTVVTNQLLSKIKFIRKNSTFPNFILSIAMCNVYLLLTSFIFLVASLLNKNSLGKSKALLKSISIINRKLLSGDFTVYIDRK